MQCGAEKRLIGFNAKPTAVKLEHFGKSQFKAKELKEIS